MSVFLLVDDDDVFRSVLARSLVRRGFDVLEASDSQSALDVLKTEKPDTCVLDLKLGNESGLRLLPELLRLRPSLKVVVLTGYASIVTAVDAVKQGALNYLPKPADVDEILAVFNKSGANIVEGEIESSPMSVDRLEWEHIQRVLAENNGNISETARALNMHRRTLQRKLQKRPVQQ